MPKYRVVKAYNHEVKVGDIIETKNLHPALKAHVVLADEADTLEVATPKPEPTAAELKRQQKELEKEQKAKEKALKDADTPPGEGEATDPAPKILGDEEGPGENS